MEDYLSEIYRLQHELNCKIGVDTINDEKKKEWLFQFSWALHDEVQELANSCHWKWWSKSVKENPELMFKGVKDEKNAKIEAIDCLHFLMSIFQILDMTPEDIVNIYRYKHEKNCLRQENGYDINIKTEDDNNEIKNKI